MRSRSIFGLAVTVFSALALTAGAGAVGTSMPFAQTFINPCTGEMVMATGTFVFSQDLTVGPNGRTHERSYMSFHGMSATAPVSGRKYVVQDQTIEGTNSDLDGVPSTTHFSFRAHWVRTGETGALIDDDDFYDWFHFHLTINSNGVPTSLKVETEDEYPPCR
jgi:hypothetical protein